MKATVLHQPWASAIPYGLKAIETRGFRSHYRGDLAICAGKKWNDQDQEDWAYGCDVLGLPARLPLGCVVAVVDLYDVKRSEDLVAGLSPTEAAYGNYAPGRFGWLLRDIRPLAEPVPIRGQQGMWTIGSIDLQNVIWAQVAAFKRKMA